MKHCLWILAFSLLLLTSLAFAAVPRTINYQGYLKDAAGKPVSVSIPMVFSLYSSSAGQTPIWTEPQTVEVNNGIFSVTLGSAAPLDVSAFSSQLYLGIKVGNDPSELQPRHTLTSVPYALQAGCKPGDGVECYTGPPATRNITPCKPGKRVCAPDGIWGACASETLPQAETANGLDDDCDGVVDNPSPQTDCLPGVMTTCYTGAPGTQGIGICKSGSLTCGTDGFWGTCIGAVLPQPESMNGLDDNCDGVVDNFICSQDVQCLTGQFCNNGSCQTKQTNGSACQSANQCTSGLCSDNVCTSTSGCTVAADCGADTACTTRICVNFVCGTSFVLAGTAVQNQTIGDCKTAVCNGSGAITSSANNADLPDDGNQCTTDLCSNGNPLYLAAPSNTPCSGGVCNGTGACVQCNTTADCGTGTQCTTPSCIENSCVQVQQPNGSACSDDNACTQLDVCQSGICSGLNPVTCAPQDQCHDAGFCNPVTGACFKPAKADGTACSDDNACTLLDVCQAGICSGSTPVTCAAPDQCHLAGTCNPATGACNNPNKADNTACDDGNPGTSNDVCIAGTCL